jgi:hypothetical protein
MFKIGYKRKKRGDLRITRWLFHFLLTPLLSNERNGEMKSQSEIERLADLRCEEACCLLNNKLWDGAFYLAGYSIELLLKARICKNLQIDNFFEFKLPVKKEFYRVFKNHNIRELMMLAGIYDDFVRLEVEDKIFLYHWSKVEKWNEASRYLINKTEEDATNFIISAKSIGLWIKEKL